MEGASLLERDDCWKRTWAQILEIEAQSEDPEIPYQLISNQYKLEAVAQWMNLRYSSKLSLVNFSLVSLIASSYQAITRDFNMIKIMINSFKSHTFLFIHFFVISSIYFSGIFKSFYFIYRFWYVLICDLPILFINFNVIKAYKTGIKNHLKLL